MPPAAGSCMPCRATTSRNWSSASGGADRRASFPFGFPFSARMRPSILRSRFRGWRVACER
jgi:hypothetical protein